MCSTMFIRNDTYPGLYPHLTLEIPHNYSEIHLHAMGQNLLTNLADDTLHANINMEDMLLDDIKGFITVLVTMMYIYMMIHFV